MSSPLPQPEGPKAAASDAAQAFASALEQLASVGGFAIHASSHMRGHPTSQAGAYASVVHAKMAGNARSIGAVAKSSMFDHSAVLSLSRMLMEGLTLCAYLLEDVSEEEWELRRTVIKLHDTVSRINFIRAWNGQGERESLDERRVQLVATVEALPRYRALREEQRARLVGGRELYIRGMRNAAVAAGWREETFNSLYGYFSSHSHALPISFTRFREQQIDFFEPSDAQFSIASLAVGVASACLNRATLLLLDGDLEAADALHVEVLAEMRAENEKPDIFQSGIA